MSRLSRGFENIGGGGPPIPPGGNLILASLLNVILINPPPAFLIVNAPANWFITGAIIRGVNINGVNVWPIIAIGTAGIGDLIYLASLTNLGINQFINLTNCNQKVDRCIVPGDDIFLQISTPADATNFMVNVHLLGVAL
jgi:hypothetical protein